MARATHTHTHAKQCKERQQPAKQQTTTRQQSIFGSPKMEHFRHPYENGLLMFCGEAQNMGAYKFCVFSNYSCVRVCMCVCVYVDFFLSLQNMSKFPLLVLFWGTRFYGSITYLPFRAYGPRKTFILLKTKGTTATTPPSPANS